MPIELKTLHPGDEAVLTKVGPDVFDHAVDPRSTEEFLADPRHHLAVAIEAGVVVGFASAVHHVHPDKRLPELWINEVGVASTHRGRGLGRALLGCLFEAARESGCAEAWVLTERSNPTAMRLYASAGGVEAPEDAVMFSFRLDAPGEGDRQV